MRYTFGHITDREGNSRMSWLLMLLLLVYLTACSSADDEELAEPNPEAEAAANNNGPRKAPTKLYIYVYAPEAPEVTRGAYDGEVLATGNEASVYKMQIWVFTHNSHNLLGYYESTGASSLSALEPYELLQLTIDETYAETAEANREHVDVYVLANVSAQNCNLTLDHTATQAQLDAALLKKTTADPFGVTSPVREVPENLGLPMSGILRDKPVTGTTPVLRLDDGGEIATVMLRRVVSKLRFAFSRQTGSEPLQINSIRLGTEMIPKSEYLFMTEAEPYDRHTCHINTADGYDTATPNLLDEVISDVATNDDPVVYAWGYEELEPQLYERKIDNAVTAGDLTQRTFFLRESNKLLQGTIKYQIGNGEEQTATFRMVDEGGFSRNHIWTVYAYQAQAHVQVVVAEVAPWRLTEENNDFYNW